MNNPSGEPILRLIAIDFDMSNSLAICAKSENLDVRCVAQASELSKLSLCPVRKVGALIVKDNKVIGQGYNKLPVNLSCWCQSRIAAEKDKSLKVCMAIHAEQDAILDALSNGAKCDGATIYTTTCPCLICAKMIIHVGIKRVVYVDEYCNANGYNALAEAGLEVKRVPKPHIATQGQQ